MIYALLSTYQNLTWVQPSLEITAAAAKIRGIHGLKRPDSLQAATVFHSQPTAIISNVILGIVALILMRE